MNFFSFCLHMVVLIACFFFHYFDLTVWAFLFFGFYVLYLLSEIEAAVYKLIDREKGK